MKLVKHPSDAYVPKLVVEGIKTGIYLGYETTKYYFDRSKKQRMKNQLKSHLWLVEKYLNQVKMISILLKG